MYLRYEDKLDGVERTLQMLETGALLRLERETEIPSGAEPSADLDLAIRAPLFVDDDQRTRSIHLDRVAVLLAAGAEIDDFGIGQVRNVQIRRNPQVLTLHLTRIDDEEAAAERFTEAVRRLNTLPQVLFAGPSESVLNDLYSGCDPFPIALPLPRGQCPPSDEGDLALEQVRAAEAWQQLAHLDDEGFRRSVVAVIDTGVDIAHPDLAPALITDYDANQWDFTQGQTGYGDPDHGSLVSGVAVAAAGQPDSVAGIAPRAKLLPVAVPLYFYGDYEDRASAILEAVRWIRHQQGRKMVMNLSWFTNGDVGVVRGAIQLARSNDVVVVTGAGNNGRALEQCRVYPAVYPECLTTAAVGADLGKFPSSNFGAAVKLAAPGSKCSTANTSLQGRSKPPFETFGETSCSTAIVSGAAALVRAANPDLSAADVESLLVDTARSIEDHLDQAHKGRMGKLVDCAAAVEEALRR
jgi:hypothetical protein